MTDNKSYVTKIDSNHFYPRPYNYKISKFNRKILKRIGETQKMLRKLGDKNFAN